jgi:putative PIN family toxin of toxin-antitoxin system
MLRVVSDTNVIIAAFFWKGHPRTLYDLIRAKKITMLLSRDIQAELIRVLAYKKFGLSSQEIKPFVRSIRANSEFIEVNRKVSQIAADPTDNIFLACAADGHADYIISGDRHLLEVINFEGIQIVNPKDFLLKEGFLTDR